MQKDVMVIIGASGIGIAIARRSGFGKTILLADFNSVGLAAAQEMTTAGYEVEPQMVYVASRESVNALAKKAAS